MNTDSNSLYYKLRMEGKSDCDAQEQCADHEADQMEMRMEHQLHDYLEVQE